MTETPSTRHRWPRLRRVVTPAGLVLTLTMFFFGFVAVSCSTPGGFGRGGPGATTTYTGVALITRGAPEVTADHQVAINAQLPDGVGPIVWLASSVILILLALAAAWALPQRHDVIGGTAAAGAISLGVGGWQAWRSVVDLVTEQVSPRLQSGQKPSQFVQVLPPYWIAVGLLAGIALLHGVASIRDAQQPETAPGRHGGAHDS